MNKPFNTKLSVFKTLYNSKETPFEQTIIDVYERIKNGNLKLIETIEKVRNAKTKDEADEVKKTLAVICFNGTFRERNIKGLIEHSGLCIIDLDGFENEDVYISELENLINFPATVMAFRSPSGKGLKGVIRIPKSTSEEHTRRFNAIGLALNSQYWDDKCKDVSRVCFESYDPNIYLNQFAQEFAEIEEEQGYYYTERVPTCIIENEQKIIDLIMKFNFKGSFSEGQRNNYVFSIAGLFCEYGVSQMNAESYILSNVVNGKFSEQETLTTIKSAYRRRQFKTRYFEDREQVKVIESKIIRGYSKEEITKSHNVSAEIINDIIEQKEGISEIFWEIKKTKGGGENISIEPFKYANFLVKNGFMKYYPESAEQPTFVRVFENKVRLSSPEIIKDFVLQFLYNSGNINVWNYVTKSPFLFTSNHLNMIDSIHLKMLQDSKEESYLPYKNGVVKVTKDSLELLSYRDVDFYIWENQIIQREFKKVDKFDNDFKDFISKISAEDNERTKSLETTLGYLVHSFKDKTDQKAIIFNDQEIDDNPNGGSGKSLMLNAISYIRKMVKIDGKAFDPKKSDFVYQRVNLDTQILAFDDVKKYFNFEQLFSLITEGITVNRKNKDEIFIPFERSPKIVITTNYVINGAGNSHERRRHEIEVFQYFNNRRTPIKEYGRLLFDSWNLNDWLLFDNYIVNCLQLYLKDGLFEAPIINSEKKRLIQATNSEFYSWAVEDENIIINTRLYNAETMGKFIAEHKQYKDINTKTFLKWCQEYAKYINAKFIKERDHNGRYFEIEKEDLEDTNPPF